MEGEGVFELRGPSDGALDATAPGKRPDRIHGQRVRFQATAEALHGFGEEAVDPLAAVGDDEVVVVAVSEAKRDRVEQRRPLVAVEPDGVDPERPILVLVFPFLVAKMSQPVLARDCRKQRTHDPKRDATQTSDKLDSDGVRLWEGLLWNTRNVCPNIDTGALTSSLANASETCWKAASSSTVCARASRGVAIASAAAAMTAIAAPTAARRALTAPPLGRAR